MKYFSTKIIDIDNSIKGTLIIKIEKPADYKYWAGQYILLKPIENAKPKAFSLASAPYEDYLMLATRYSESEFKIGLKQLISNDEILISQSMGHLALPKENGYDIVLLAGGVGVVPFRSFVKQAIYENVNYNIFLFSSDIRIERKIFFNEFRGIKNKLFTYIPICTREESLDCENERISYNLLKKYIKNLFNKKFYIVGNNNMVAGIKNDLINNNIDIDNIITENFG